MKTGEQVKNRALQLLRYTDGQGRLDAQMYTDVTAQALPLVNQIYSDVWYGLYDEGFAELGAITDELPLPERVVNDVMPYGVAMLMAQTLGDADNQSLMAAYYNRKRASLTHMRGRKDVMPRAL